MCINNISTCDSLEYIELDVAPGSNKLE